MLSQLNSIIDEYYHTGVSGLDMNSHMIPNDYAKIQSLITRSRAAIVRASGQESEYNKQLQFILGRHSDDTYTLNLMIGIVESLATDITAGYLSSASELIHGEIFGDFLEMADYLLEEGYKDAAAVIAGSSLEAHLRQLCIKHNIAIEWNNANGIQPKKADSLNSDLAKVDIITKLDQKNVTAWLDLRNKAAHGKYEEYQKEQVNLMIAGIRDFITRYQA